MFLEFSDNLCPACELSAWVWNDGNYSIGYWSVDRVVIDVNLLEISLLHEKWTVSRTTLAAFIVPLTTKS